MKAGIKRWFRPALLATSIIVLVVTILAFCAIATPRRYRSGVWLTLPALDEQLLPHVVAFAAAVFGAFFGSLSAFYLGRLQQQSDRREKRHSALIAAQYALISQWNIVEGIRVQHLEEFRNHPARFTKLRLFVFKISPSYVPFSDLTFVLETEDPNILHDVHLAEQSYQSCMEALTVRNQQLEKFYENPNVTHRILNFETGAGITEASQKDLLFLRQATDALFTSVDRTLPRLAAAIEKLEKVSKVMFPGKRALRMTPQTGAAASPG